MPTGWCLRTCSCIVLSQSSVSYWKVCVWGGVGGMLSFLGLAHMLDATQWMGWGGLGGMLTFLSPAHMLDATQWMGWVGEPHTGGVDSAWQLLKESIYQKFYRLVQPNSTATNHTYIQAWQWRWENNAVPNLCKKTAMAYLCEKDT